MVYVQTFRNRLLDRMRSSPSIYRVTKRAQPTYLKWLSLRTSAFRALVATPAISRLLHNPTRIGVAIALATDDQDAASVGLRAASLHPNVRARRTLPPGLEGHASEVFARVQREESGAGNVYTLLSGRVWGADGAIVSRDRRLIGDLSPVIRLAAEAHPIFHRPITVSPKRLDGSLAVATGPSAGNLSHWLLFVLPRLSLLGQWDPGLTHIDWVLTPARTASFHDECLRRFDVPPAKTVAAHAGTFIEARQIVAPSFVSPAFVAPSWFLDDLRQRFSDVTPATGVPRIYVSRRDAPGRRVNNEAAVAAALAPYGFQTIQLEHLPFLEQVALFKGAETIVAAHGAGLTHLAFARANASVVELFSPAYVNPMYWCLADELGLRYRCCIGNPTTTGVRRDLVRENITVDIQRLTSIVESLTT
jgi:hypothetical protein